MLACLSGRSDLPFKASRWLRDSNLSRMASAMVVSPIQACRCSTGSWLVTMVGRVGEFGGYAVLETDQPADIHRLTTVFAAFRIRLELVLDVGKAVATEAAAIAWRDGLAG